MIWAFRTVLADAGSSVLPRRTTILVEGAFDILRGQIANRNAGDRRQMSEDVLVAGICVGADRAPSRLIEPRAEVVAKALLCQLQPVALLGLEVLERGERASAGVGIPDLPGRPTKISAMPHAAD
jgi:hypothetical protein